MRTNSPETGGMGVSPVQIHRMAWSCRPGVKKRRLRNTHGYAERRRAFTLVELLIVISITATLIALLLPALGGARRSSQRAVCASNLHQIHTANIAFSTNNRGRLAPGAADFLNNLDRWFGHREQVGAIFQPDGGPLSPFLGPDGAVRRCPALRITNPDPRTDFEAGCGGYGYNRDYLGIDEDGNDETGVRSTAIHNEAQTIIFTDSAFAMNPNAPRLIEYSFATPPRQRDHPEFALDPSTHFRHEKQANIAWADGHVGSESMSFTRANIYGIDEPTMQNLQIGFFGPDTNQLFDLR